MGRSRRVGKCVSIKAYLDIGRLVVTISKGDRILIRVLLIDC